METKKLNWSKGNGLLPAIIQDFNSKDILMLGFMNEEALERTLSENKVTFFSRTQDKLWRKGDTSGNSLCVKDIAIDCDKDTILVQAVNDGPTCHEGSYSCFGEQMFSLQKLEKIITIAHSLFIFENSEEKWKKDDYVKKINDHYESKCLEPIRKKKKKASDVDLIEIGKNMKRELEI